VNILLPFEQAANEVIKDNPKLMHFKYFFTRKLIFVKESDAIVLYPGGFGTHDEAFETLTLVQTGKNTPCPIVMVDTPRGNYWKAFDHFIDKQLVNKNLIHPDDRHLYKIVTSPEAAVKECLKFYQNYQSLRNFPDHTVLRVKRKPTKKLLTALNRKFSDLLEDGSFQLAKPEPEELVSEPKSAKLYRISFHFNRKDLGLLRLLIDYLNEKG